MLQGLSRVKFSFALVSLGLSFSRPFADDPLNIPAGKPVVIDGEISKGEWDDANFVEIRIREDWRVRVGAKHDFKNLYFVFEGVTHGEERLFPEILIDPGNWKTTVWKKGQWWFHISNNLCEGNGEPNAYEKKGVFQCAHKKNGWDGNNPAGEQIDAIEVLIAFAKLKDLSFEKPFGIAFDMTNAAGDQKQRWYFWPPKAEVMSPSSWGQASIRWMY